MIFSKIYLFFKNIKIVYPTYYYLPQSHRRTYRECICVPGTVCLKGASTLDSDVIIEKKNTIKSI
jgi:hypothetical protein